MEGLKNAINGNRLKLYVIKDGSSEGPEKRKECMKENDVPPPTPTEKTDVEESIDPNFSFRKEGESESSEPIIVGHHKGDTLMDFIPTGEQWQKGKSIIFDVKVKKY